MSRVGTELSIQINDQPKTSRQDVSASPVSRLDVSFGAQKFGTFSFDGLIGEVRMYQGALDEAQVTSLVQEISSFYNNQPPTAQPDTYALNEDAVLFYQSAEEGVLANDADNEDDPITAKLVSPTSHGTLTFNEDGSFFYDPDDDFFGTDTFTYAAVDFRESPAVTVTLEVAPVYDRPMLTADQYKTQPHQPLAVSSDAGLLINDINRDQVELVASLTRDVDQGVLDLRPDGSFDYDPQGFAGTATFAYRVHDGTDFSDPVDVTLIVNTPLVRRMTPFSRMKTRFKHNYRRSFCKMTPMPMAMNSPMKSSSNRNTEI